MFQMVRIDVKKENIRWGCTKVTLFIIYPYFVSPLLQVSVHTLFAVC